MAAPIPSNSDLAKDGFLLASGLFMTWAGSGSWLSGLGIALTCDRARHLFSYVKTRNFHPSDVIAGIFKRMVPSNFPIDAYKKKILNATIGGLCGVGIAQIPGFQAVAGLSSFVSGALGAAVGYIGADLTGSNRIPPRDLPFAPRAHNSYHRPLRQYYREDVDIFEEDDTYDDNENKIDNTLFGSSRRSVQGHTILNQQLKHPISFDDNYQFYTIQEAYHHYLDHIEKIPQKALFEVAWRAFYENSGLDNTPFPAFDYYLDGIQVRHILNRASTRAKKELQKSSF